MSPPPQSSSVAKQQPQSQSQSQSQLLTIAAEVRLTIWKFAVPSGDRLLVDPDNVRLDHDFHCCDYSSAFSLLRTSRQVLAEVLPTLYSQNTICIACPSIEFDSFYRLPKLAIQNISSVELCVDSLQEAAVLWRELTWKLSSLKHIKLSFIHTDDWVRDTAIIARHCFLVEDVYLRLELSESTWAKHNASPMSKDLIDDQFIEADDHLSLYWLTIPDGVKAITVAAEVRPEVVGPEVVAVLTNFKITSRATTPTGSSSGIRIMTPPMVRASCGMVVPSSPKWSRWRRNSRSRNPSITEVSRAGELDVNSKIHGLRVERQMLGGIRMVPCSVTVSRYGLQHSTAEELKQSRAVNRLLRGNKMSATW